MADEDAAKTTEQKPKTGLIAGIIAAVVVVIVIVCVFAFGGGSKVAGKYNITAFIEDGKESTEMIDLLKAFGGSYTIEFKNDKTGVLEMKAGDENQTMNFKWDDKKIYVDNEGKTEESDYEYKDDTVTVTIEGKGMKFKREGK